MPIKYNGKDITYVDIPISITTANGKPALEIRKIVTICDKNQAFIDSLLEISLKGEKVLLPAQIYFQDSIKASLKLKELKVKDLKITLKE